MNIRNIFAVIFLIVCFMQASAQNPQNNYAEKWKKIDSLITKKGLTQSALQEVDAIYAKAKTDKNDAQLIKALLYKMNLKESGQEDAGKKNIAEMEES